MWYFAWIIGILLACSLGIINGLWFEQVETNEKEANDLAEANSSNDD